MGAPRIRILPPELADQIAAGEVVERPAAVVKELVENALDAGAGRIEVELERGGLRRILVQDDGCGMSAEEAQLAVRRHATSKLRAFEDLSALSTMGFRGEALPSIAAVSRLVLTTRAADAPDTEGAYRIEIAGGIPGEGRAVGAPPGTCIEVFDLFANVPARLKFLKTPATETGHVSDTITRVALAFPSVHFRLRLDGRLHLDLPPHPPGPERARAALRRGGRPAPSLHRAEGEELGVRVEAYLGSPSEAGTARQTFALVNRRFVRDRGLYHAIAMGYGETLERGRHPLAVVHVTMSGAEVDVNVHPQKLEVRFARPQDVFAAVRHAIARVVARAPWLAEGPGAAVQPYAGERGGFSSMAESPRAGYEEHRRRAAEALRLFAPGPTLFPAAPPASSAPPGDGGPAGIAAAIPPALSWVERPLQTGAPTLGPGLEGPTEARSAAAETGFFTSLTYLGQLERTYLVCEAPGELVLIDQHAAHERVAFERLRQAHARRALPVQRLLLPITLELDPSLVGAVSEHAALLAELGFEVEPFGAGTLAVRALPEAVAALAPAETLRELLEELAQRGTTRTLEDRTDHALATLACHSVVRAGQTLGEPQVRALFRGLDQVDYRAHCPHGRPVLVRIALGELERRFGRS